MILWLFKLISSIRRAVAGRKYPHQLAWAVAFGLLLGIVPHGNLLAVAILFVVLSLKINHAMAGITAIATTFLATKLDPYSHEVGNFLLTHPQLSQTASSAWSLPLVPWTDLNNTVVMGSFLIGVGALVPVFVVAYPVFRLLAPSTEPSAESTEWATPPSNGRIASAGNEDTHHVVLIDHGHEAPSKPHVVQHDDDATQTPDPHVHLDDEPLDFIEIEEEPESEAGHEPQVAIETRIDVIRMTDHRTTDTEQESSDCDANDPQPMDEALNYLLRQLRDSQQRKAA